MTNEFRGGAAPRLDYGWRMVFCVRFWPVRLCTPPWGVVPLARDQLLDRRRQGESTMPLRALAEEVRAKAVGPTSPPEGKRGRPPQVASSTS